MRFFLLLCLLFELGEVVSDGLDDTVFDALLGLTDGVLNCPRIRVAVRLDHHLGDAQQRRAAVGAGVDLGLKLLHPILEQQRRDLGFGRAQQHIFEHVGKEFGHALDQLEGQRCR